jgi:hypothetical protein
MIKVFLITVTIIALLIYFLPSVIVYNKNRRCFWLIFLLNLFLGWTILVWFVCLIMAFTNKQRVRR